VRTVSEVDRLLSGSELLRKAIDGMAMAAQYGGDTRGLTILLNMRAALDAADIALLKRWMTVLENHASRRKSR
jgi:hypothetical protein